MVLRMSSTAAETGDVGDHPEEHAVFRGQEGASPGQKPGQEGECCYPGAELVQLHKGLVNVYLFNFFNT